MKASLFSFVVIADQIRSRSADDRVPRALESLSALPVALPFERTAGDELQGLIADPAGVVGAVVRLTRLEHWRIGIGAGAVATPLPPSTRAARGAAYLSARAAIAAARREPTALALRAGRPVGSDRYGEDVGAVRHAESALWLLRSLLGRRSREGWELMDLLDEGLTNAQAAARLRISPSAVSQRLARAGRIEEQRGSELAVHLLERLRATGEEAA